MLNRMHAALNWLPIKPEIENHETLFARQIPPTGELLSIRSLNIGSDLKTIHHWVTQSYAQRFWQLNRSVNIIEGIYESVLQNPLTHSFIACIDEHPIAQIDVYAIITDELNEHIPGATAQDAGLHLLMCPPREMQKGWSKQVLLCFQEFYFGSPQTMDLYAEPDKENYHANRLAINTGFRFQKTIQLSYKTANLYRISRTDFAKYHSH